MSKETTRAPEVLTASDGATAVKRVDGLSVHAPDGRVLFEYRVDAEGARCVVHAPTQHLELHADEGSISLHAKEEVRISGSELLGAVEGVQLDADRVRVSARTVQTMADVVQHTVGVVEVTADRVLERVKNAYREVEGLSQTRAGRIRHIARGSFQLLGRRTVLKAEEDMKLKGSKIHIG